MISTLVILTLQFYLWSCRNVVFKSTSGAGVCVVKFGVVFNRPGHMRGVTLWTYSKHRDVASLFMCKYVILYSLSFMDWNGAGSTYLISHLFLLKAQIPKCLKRQELQETHFHVFVSPFFHLLMRSYSQIKGRAIPKYWIFDLFNISFNSSTFLAPAVTITGIFNFSANLAPISA